MLFLICFNLSAQQMDSTSIKTLQAFEDFDNQNWQNVISIFDEFKSKGIWMNHQLYYRASISCQNLADQISDSTELTLLQRRRKQIFEEGVEEFDQTLMTKGYDSEVYDIVDQHPKPPKGFNEYLGNYIYPESALNNGIQGSVFLTFTLNPDGTVDGVKVIKGIHSECDELAKNLIIESPNWSPGIHRGTPRYVRIIWPVQFNIKKYKKKIKAQSR